jgi:hypothetical protein
MGFRWYKGQFIDTNEYRQIKKQEEDSSNRSAGTAILFIVLYGLYIYFSGLNVDSLSKMDYIMFFVSLGAAYFLNKLGLVILKIAIGIFVVLLLLSFLGLI